MLLGLGALGAGAVGARLVLSPEPEVEPPPPRPATSPPSTAPSTPPASEPTATRPTSTAADVEPTTTTTTTAAASVVAAWREAWGAEQVSGAMVEHVPVRLTLHHTAVSQTALSQGPARARQHQRHHQSLGWPDLAYHFLVDRSGLAYEGRDVRFRGDTGTEYDPTGHFLVCVEGDFDSQEPTDAQLETAVALLAWASQRYGIDSSTLAGHGSYAVTSCPGATVSAMIPEMAAAIAGTGPVEIELVCGSDGARLVADLEAG